MEPHAGPFILDANDKPTSERDPSPEQIRRMTEAIRRHLPREPQGYASEPWELPEIAAPEWFDVPKVG